LTRSRILTRHPGASQGIVAVSFRFGITEEDEDRVADELVDRAAVLKRDIRHLAEIGIHEKREPLRLHAVTDIGEAFDIGEEDGEVLAGQRIAGFALARKDRVIDLRRKVFGKPVRQAFKLLGLDFDQLSVAQLVFKQLFALLSKIPFGGSVHELALHAVEIAEGRVVRLGGHERKDLVHPVDPDRDLGDEDQAARAHCGTTRWRCCPGGERIFRSFRWSSERGDRDRQNSTP
jgi:hypothetical protein